MSINLNKSNATHVKTFFYKQKRVDIVSVEHEKGLGYHFKITNPCNKNERCYSVPFILLDDCEKASMMIIKENKI